MKEFLNNLTDREKNLLSVMAVAVVLFLLYFAVYRPLEAAKQSSDRSLVAAERVLETVQKAAQFAQMHDQVEGQLAVKDDRPVRVIVAITARAAGVKISRIQPSETGSVTLWIDSVSPQNFYTWVQKLYEDHAIMPTKVSMQKGGTQTSIRVQVQFEGTR